MKRLLLTLSTGLIAFQPVQAGVFGFLRHPSRTTAAGAKALVGPATQLPTTRVEVRPSVVEAEVCSDRGNKSQSNSQSRFRGFFRKVVTALGAGALVYGAGYYQGHEDGQDGKQALRKEALAQAQAYAKEAARVEALKTKLEYRQGGLAQVLAAGSAVAFDQYALDKLVRDCSSREESFQLFDHLVAVSGQAGLARVMNTLLAGDSQSFSWFADYVFTNHIDELGKYIKAAAILLPCVSDPAEMKRGLKAGWHMDNYIEPIQWDKTYFDQKSAALFMQKLWQYLNDNSQVVRSLLGSMQGVHLLSTLMSASHNDVTLIALIEKHLNDRALTNVVPSHTSIYFLNQLLLKTTNKATKLCIMQWSLAHVDGIMALSVGKVGSGSTSQKYDQSHALLYNLEKVAKELGRDNMAKELRTKIEVKAYNGWFNRANYNRYGHLVDAPPA